MGIFALAISVCFLAMSFIFLQNKPLHPATLFFGLYSLILLFSNLNMYGMLKPSDEAFLLIILMLCSFAVGSLNSFFPIIKLINGNKKNTPKRYHLDIKLFYILTIIAISVLLYDIIIVVKNLLNDVPLWQIRNWVLSKMGSDNPIMSNRSFIEEFIRTVILEPVGMIIPPVAAYCFFDVNQKKNKKKILMLALLHVALTSIAGGGGRLRIVYFGGCFFVAYLLFANRKQFRNFNKKKYRKYILIIALIAIMVVVAVTFMRLGGAGYVWRSIYKYFALPPTLLSVWLPEIENASPTYGMLSFYGIMGYFFRGLKMIGLEIFVPEVYNDAYDYILKAQEFRNVGYGIGNAYVTPIYYMIIDGGKMFLCLDTILLSSIAASVHKRIKKDADIRSFLVYVMVMYGVFETFMTIITAVPIHMITFIFIWLVCRKQKPE